jgi:predicted aminopeptidase
MRIRSSCLLVTLLILAGLVVGLSSCSNLGYYRQCAVGQIDILARRQAIDKVIADPRTDPELRRKLTAVLQMRDFASAELHLPDNGSYRCYADLDRPCVVWNVVATDEFSLDPIRWCFPVAGCVPYRGYYKEAAAEKFAAGLRQDGKDVYVYGVPAYSTLGWFDDPVLNTFVHRPDYIVAGLLFHELAHQQVYIKGDADFNEAFATTVETEGVRRWLAAFGDATSRQAWQEREVRREDFLDLVAATRQRLADLYSGSGDRAGKRAAKEAILNRMRGDYAALKNQWNGYSGYDRWFDGALNNARFVSVTTYRRLVPAFQRLLQEQDGDLRRFYAAVRDLAEQPPDRRRERLEALLQATPLSPAKAAATGV